MYISEDVKPQTADRSRPQRCRLIVGHRPIPLDGGYGWVIVFGAFTIHVFSDGFVYSFGVIAKSLIKEYDWSNAEISIVLSLLTGLMLAAGPLASVVCNRIGCRATTILGALLASAGCAASSYASSIGYLLLSVGVVMGCGFGLMYCPAIVIVTLYFERRRSLATGVTVCGAGVGTFVFSKVIDLLIVEFGWRAVFLIYAGMILLCVPCGALFRSIEMAPIYADSFQAVADGGEQDEDGNGRRPTAVSSTISVSASSDDGHGGLSEEQPDAVVVIGTTVSNDERRPLRKRFRSRVVRIWRYTAAGFAPFANSTFIVYAASNFLASIGFNAPPMFMPSQAEKLGFGDDDGSTSLSLYGLASVLGRIAFGLACDWRPPVRWARDAACNRLVVLAVSLMACGAATGFVFAIRSLNAYLSYSFFLGFTISSFVCLASVVLVDLVGVGQMTNAFGLLLFVQGVATFVGPPIAGWLYDLTGTYGWTFAFCGICLYVSGIILFAIPCLQPPKSGDGCLSAQWRRRDRLVPLAAGKTDENVFTVPTDGPPVCERVGR